MNKKYIMCNCCWISLSSWARMGMMGEGSPESWCLKSHTPIESGLHRHSGKFWFVHEGLECEWQEEQQERQIGLRGPADKYCGVLCRLRGRLKNFLNKSNLWFTYYKSALHRVWDSRDHLIQILAQENVNLARQKMEWNQLLLWRQLFT